MRTERAVGVRSHEKDDGRIRPADVVLSSTDMLGLAALVALAVGALSGWIARVVRRRRPQ